MSFALELFRDDPDFRILAAGSVVFEQGDPGDAMYVVLEGEVEVYVGTTKVETLAAGDIFGEMALIDRAPRAARAVAKTRCKLVSIPELRFVHLVQRTPQFSLHIMKVLADRLRKLNRLL
jgi:CRP-like cAMP-binding protein